MSNPIENKEEPQEKANPQENLGEPTLDDLVIGAFSDSTINKEEYDRINAALEKYKKEKDLIKGDVRSQLNKIRSEKEYKQYVENSAWFKEFKKEVENSHLDKKSIQNIQYNLWVKINWKLGVEDYLAFKNSPFYKNKVFRSITELRNWRKVPSGVELDKFSKDLFKMNSELWYTVEDIYIIANSVWEGGLIFFNEKTWDITVYDKDWVDAVTYNAVPEVTTVMYNTLTDKIIKREDRIKKLSDLLSFRTTKELKSEFISTFKELIANENLYEEARDLFSIKQWEMTRFSFPKWEFNSEIKAIDLFGDFAKVRVDGVVYMNNWKEFLDAKWRKLSITSRRDVKVELNFEEKESNEKLAKDILVNKESNKDALYKHLNSLNNTEDKENFVLSLKAIINKYWLYKEARKLLTNETTVNWKKWIEVSLWSPELQKHLTMLDIFWDFKTLDYKWVQFKKDKKWDFLNANDKKQELFLRNWEIYIIENWEPDEKDPKKLDIMSEWDITEKFSYWLLKQWWLRKISFKNWVCGSGLAKLLDDFLKKNWFKAMKINSYRNWRNFTTIFEEWENLEKKWSPDSFVVGSTHYNTVDSVNNLLKDAGASSNFDIRKVLDENIEFEKVEITDVRQITEWKDLFLCYDWGKFSSANWKINGHVEFSTVIWWSRKYVHSLISNFPWWSAGTKIRSSEKLKGEVMKDFEKFKEYTWFKAAYRMKVKNKKS